MLFEFRSSKLMKSAMAFPWLLLPLLVMFRVSAMEDLSAGYRVTDIEELADGSGIVAHLELIRGSEKYGPDLEDLKLTARFGHPVL